MHSSYCTTDVTDIDGYICFVVFVLLSNRLAWGGGLTGGNSDTILSSNLFFLGCVSVVLPRHYKIFMEASD